MNTQADIAKLQRDVRELQRATRHIPVRFSTGGGGAKYKPYTATTKAGLPSSVEAWALGFVTAGTEQGRWYHRNPGNTAWVALNFLE